MDNDLKLSATKSRTSTSDPVDKPSSRSDAAPKGCGHKTGSRNLIVCIDGTANQFGNKNTNVIELYSLILKEFGDNQRTWYNSGIGTYAQPSWKSLNFYKQVLGHTIDLAIAWNFERTIIGAYRWLSDNYEQGDCIFLFGFSRGAFQVRVLSAMIDKVGLIYKGNEMQIPFAYELYADPSSDKITTETHEVGSQQDLSRAERFKRAFSYKGVKVHFVGVWDTVSSIGITRSKDMLPRTIDGMTHVCYFRHALALDERRVKFLPEYAYGGSATKVTKIKDKNVSTHGHQSPHKANNPPTDEKNVDETSAIGPSAQNVDMADPLDVRQGKKSMKKRPHTLEVWFAGTHSDIGGGNAENVAMDRSRPPLRWMVFEAGALGLRMAQFNRELSSNEQVEKPNESLTWSWWPLEVWIFRRPTYTRWQDRKMFTYKPHLGSSRKIHPGQKIHSSLLLSDKTGTQYIPKARPVNDDSLFWEKLRKEGLEEWLELDMYDYAQKTMKRFVAAECQGSMLPVLQQIAMSRFGRQAVYEKVVETLRRDNLEPKIKYRLLYSIMDILKRSSQDDSHIKLSPPSKIRPLLSDLWESSNNDYQEMAQKFMLQFTDASLLVLDVGVAASVAFSPDGRCVICSNANTVQIWDAETGKLVAPFQAQGVVMSVAFSPDGTHVVAGLEDGTVWIWGVETGQPTGEPFKGHQHWVTSVAFSPDSRHVVSSSSDRTVQIWDVETGKPVGDPFREHDYKAATAFTFLPNSKCVVCSYHKTFKIWDVETGELVGDPFPGPKDLAASITPSPDGRRVIVVYGDSTDMTIQVWDVETAKPLGEPFQGPTTFASSVALSPDGKRVVSSSVDYTIKIWDAETGKPLVEPFQGHASYVMTVAFSPDGRRVVSGSVDNTVRIWDAETG